MVNDGTDSPRTQLDQKMDEAAEMANPGAWGCARAMDDERESDAGQGQSNEAHLAENLDPADDIPLAVLTRAHRHLLQSASEHVHEQRYQEAILIAQAAAEACSARAITALLSGHPESLRDALDQLFGSNSNYNLTRKGPQKAWTFLTGDVITEQPFSSRYQKNTQRRNAVAHITAPDLKEADADESLKAATEFIAHLEAVTGQMLGSDSW